MKIELKITKLPEFERDLKHLRRKFNTIDEDLFATLETQLAVTHILNKENYGAFRIPGLGNEQSKIFKIKKFPCKSLKGRGAKSGLRIIYAFIESEKRVELIEIYFKQDKEMEDRKRIRKHYS